MNVNVKETFNKGFILNESEFRRIVQISQEQIDKIKNKGQKEEIVKVEFLNGVIQKNISIDDLFNLENHGQESIKSIKYSLKLHLEIDQKKSNEDTKIEESLEKESSNSNKVSLADLLFNEPVLAKVEIEFNSVGHDRRVSLFSDDPVELNVNSIDRDWVFVTNSLLKDRIKKLERSPVPQWLSSRLLIPVLAIIALLLTSTFLAPSSEINKQEPKQPTFAEYIPNSDLEINKTTKLVDLYSDEIEKLRAKTIDSTILCLTVALDKYFLEQETLTNLRNSNRQKWFLEENEKYQKELNDYNQHIVRRYPLMLILLTPMILALAFAYLISKFFTKYYPLTNFVWGEYEVLFKRNQTIVRTVLITVVLGVLVSFIGGLLANML